MHREIRADSCVISNNYKGDETVSIESILREEIMMWHKSSNLLPSKCPGVCCGPIISFQIRK